MVDAARGWFGTQRVGHLGTLDPQATGVLPLAVRDATKLVPFVPSDPKVYRGTIRLGVETDTLDGDGQVVARFEGALPEREAGARGARRASSASIEQVPPMYSAVKQGGVPLYRLARRGEEVERAPRKVRIDALHAAARTESPEVDVEVVCSPGTYVRVLAAELGSRLGCGAYLAVAVPAASGPFETRAGRDARGPRGGGRAGELAARLVRPVAALGMPALRLTRRGCAGVSCNGCGASPGRTDAGAR